MFRSAPITSKHLETISVNKGAAEELRPRSALRIPQDITQRATQEHQNRPPKPVCIAFPCACERTSVCPCTYLCLLLCPHLRICVWFGRSSERDRFTDTADGVQVHNVSFESFLEFLFGLLINRSISDKTSNCFNVVSVSVLVLARSDECYKGGRTWMWFSTWEPARLCETSERSKHQSRLILHWDTTGEIFPELFITVFQ